MKTCSTCKAVKPLTEFGKKKYYCKSCSKIYWSEWRKRNIDRINNNSVNKKFRKMILNNIVIENLSISNEAKLIRNEAEKNGLYKELKLDSPYIKRLITCGTNIKEVPKELIELKRLQLKLHRELRK